MKSIVITGASSGIGKATAKHFAEQGWKVAATMRSPEKETDLTEIENISLYQLDVTDEASITKATEQIISDFATVDVLLNNAGYGLVGPFEIATQEQIKRQYDTNVFGLMSVTRAFLPHFRANKAGMILNVSSIGGLVTFPLFSLYHSTKWAVEGFSESLSYELASLGIQVKIIEPGGVETDFGGRSMDFAMSEDLTAYNELIATFQKNWAENRSLGRSTAEYLAEEIYKATTDGTNQLRYLIGMDAIEIYGMRKEHGDDMFIAGIKDRLLS